MVEPVTLSIAIGFLVKSAPGWFHTLQDTLLSKGKDFAIEQGKQKIIGFIDEKKHLHHMELALKNAAERGLRKFQTPAERDQYRSILEILAEGNSEALRQEAIQLFTLSDNPNLTELTEKYNLRQRISALAQQTIHEEVDAAPYLNSFFEGLIAELYNDPLFREQMSDVIRVRAALTGQQTWEEMRTILNQIYNKLADDYTEERFQQEVETYLEYVEMKFRLHNFTGIVFRGDEDKAPDLENIFVPVRIASRSQSASQEKARDDMRSMFEQSPYLVLLGGPGSGKSTLTRYIAWSHAKANSTPSSVLTTKNSVLLANKPVPLRIELRLLSEARKKHNGGFLSYASEVMLREEDISIHTQMFIELLERKMMLVLFDGLDEVPTLSERRQLIEQVEIFSQRYPGNHIMVTSRPVGYEIARFTNPWFLHSDIEEFNDEQIHAFLEAWYTYVLKFPFLTGEVRRELDMFYTTLQNNSRLHKLATNPLLLTVMAALHRYKRLPDKRVDLYAECADLLLDTWARLKYKEPRWKDMKMGKTNQRDCIAHLGFFLHARSQEPELSGTTISRAYGQSVEDAATDVPAEDMQREIERFLKNENLLSGAEINTEAESFLDLVKKEAGLIVERGTDERGPLYGFVHRTFQEYFAAVDVYERYEQDKDTIIINDFLKEHLHDPHWNEVILLLIGQLRHKQVTALLRRILHGEIKSRRSTYTNIIQQDLFFICTCFSEETLVEQDFAEDVISRVGNLVRTSPFSSQRKEALKVLGLLIRTQQYADLARRELWNLVTINATPDISTIIQSAATLYLVSSNNSAEQQQAIKVLLDIARTSNLPAKKIILASSILYRISPRASVMRQEAFQLLSDLMLQSKFSFEETLENAELFMGLLDDFSENSEELTQQVQLLLAIMRRPEFLIEQAMIIFKLSGDRFEEEQTYQLVLELIQQPITPTEQDKQNFDKVLEQIPQTLLDLMQRPDISIEEAFQVAKEIFGLSTSNIESEPLLKAFTSMRQQAFQIILNLMNATHLPLDQQVLVAQFLYENSPDDSKELEMATQMLLALVKRPDLSFEQQMQLAQSLYNSSRVSPEELEIATQMLLALAKRPDLSFEQQMQLAQSLYNSSRVSPEEQKIATQMLLALAKRPDLSFEQQMQLAQFLEENSSDGSEEQRMATQMLLAFVKRPDLSFEQQMQLAQFLDKSSAANPFPSRQSSKTQKVATENLLALVQQSDLSIEQQVRVAQFLYQNRSSTSEAYWLAQQKLLELAQRTDLASEQLVLVAQILYRFSYKGTEERQQAIQTLWQLVQKENLPIDERLRIAVLPLTLNENNYSERVQAIKMVLSLIQGEEARAYFEKYWQKIAEHGLGIRSRSKALSDLFFQDVSSVVTLAQQELLPTTARDEMYQVLRPLIPQFDEIYELNE